MYKKLLLFIILISPLLLLFIGYPIKHIPTNSSAVLATSQRCFHIGDAKEFVNCFQGHSRLGGIPLLKLTATELSDLQPSFGFLCISFFIAQVIVLIFII